MSNCANHQLVTATAYCRTCGKPLCEECRRDVRGVVYCEDCLASRVHSTLPPVADPYANPAAPKGLPNPTIAAFLGIFPGVAAFYNGQYQKGLLHVFMFPALIALTNQVEYFGVLFPLYFAYMIWDGYITAKSRHTGEIPPDPLGINNLFGLESAKGAAATANAGGPPIGALILIGLGLLFLIGGIQPEMITKYWPIVLIVVGVWKGMQRWQVED